VWRRSAGDARDRSPAAPRRGRETCFAREGPTLVGASVHPYRNKKVMLDETRRCIDSGAALFKWIPWCKQIDPRDDRCLPFYGMIADAGVPLPCHTGAELAVPTSEWSAIAFNDPPKAQEGSRQTRDPEGDQSDIRGHPWPGRQTLLGSELLDLNLCYYNLLKRW
jgi:hypothetical protein